MHPDAVSQLRTAYFGAHRLNLSDVHEDALRVLGKGNKVRMVYLNQACLDTLRDYLAVRRPITGPDRDALFLSARNQRISAPWSTPW